MYKTFGTSKAIEETRIYPEDSQIMELKESLKSFATFIAMSPHSPIFPKEDNYKYILEDRL